MGVTTGFDLKGSIGIPDRVTGMQTERLQGNFHKITNYEDNNLRAIFENIAFADPQAASRTFQAVKNTVALFRDLEYIDYSLLFKVELGWSAPEQRYANVVPTKLRAVAKLSGALQKQRITIHFLSVIDYLTRWESSSYGVSKGMISVWKNMWWTERSTIEPKRYHDRFLASLENTFTNVPALRGHIRSYAGEWSQSIHADFRRANMDVRVNQFGQKTRMGQMPGQAWLQIMNQNGAQPETVPVHFMPWSDIPYTPNQQPRFNWALLSLLILGVVGAILLCTFSYCLLKGSKPKRRRPEVRISRKQAVHC